MEIDVTGRHFQITEPLKEYAVAKTEKLDRFSLKIESAHVVMEVQKFHHIVEITLSGKNLRVTAKDDGANMYEAFDKCLDNIQTQLSRHHDRVRDHKARRYGVPGETEGEEIPTA